MTQKEVTIEEEITECRKNKLKYKRKQRDMYYLIAGFLIAFAMVGLALLGNMR